MTGTKSAADWALTAIGANVCDTITIVATRTYAATKKRLSHLGTPESGDFNDVR